MKPRKKEPAPDTRNRLVALQLRVDEEQADRYPFSVPAVRATSELRFATPVTFFEKVTRHVTVAALVVAAEGDWRSIEDTLGPELSRV